MKHYYGYWPVLAIIKQYLSNIKKRLAQDLKAEHDDPGLPGSNESQNTAPKADEELGGDEDNSSRITKAKGLKTASKKRRLNGSGKGLGVEAESQDEVEESEGEESEGEESEHEESEHEESEDEDEEVEESEVESEEVEGDEDEVKEDDDDEADLEDDKAEMEICEYYGGGRGALDRNGKEDDDEIPPIEKSVEYHVFFAYLSLTWTLFIANRNPFVNLNL